MNTHISCYQYSLIIQKNVNLVPSVWLFNATQLNVCEKVTTTPQLAVAEEPVLVDYRHEIFIALHLVYEVKMYMYAKSAMHTGILH